MKKIIIIGSTFLLGFTLLTGCTKQDKRSSASSDSAAVTTISSKKETSSSSKEVSSNSSSSSEAASSSTESESVVSQPKYDHGDPTPDGSYTDGDITVWNAKTALQQQAAQAMLAAVTSAGLSINNYNYAEFLLNGPDDQSGIWKIQSSGEQVYWFSGQTKAVGGTDISVLVSSSDFKGRIVKTAERVPDTDIDLTVTE